MSEESDEHEYRNFKIYIITDPFLTSGINKFSQIGYLNISNLALEYLQQY